MIICSVLTAAQAASRLALTCIFWAVTLGCSGHTFVQAISGESEAHAARGHTFMDWGTLKPTGKTGKKPIGKNAGKGRSRPSGVGSEGRTNVKGKKGAGGSGGGAGGSGGGDDSVVLNLAYIAMAYMAYSFLSDMWSDSAGRVEKIDFQTFRNEILAHGVVDKVCLNSFRSRCCRLKRARCTHN